MFHVKHGLERATPRGRSTGRTVAENRGRGRPYGSRRRRSQDSRHHLRRGAGATPIQHHHRSTRQSATAPGGQPRAERRPVDEPPAFRRPSRPARRRAHGRSEPPLDQPTEGELSPAGCWHLEAEPRPSPPANDGLAAGHVARPAHSRSRARLSRCQRRPGTSLSGMSWHRTSEPQGCGGEGSSAHRRSAGLAHPCRPSLPADRPRGPTRPSRPGRPDPAVPTSRE